MKMFGKYECACVRRAYSKGEKIADLAKEWGCSYNTIRNIVRNLSHPDDNYKVLSKIPTDDKFLKKHRKAGKTLEQLQQLEFEHSGRPAKLSIESIRQRVINEDN